jgi:class 3 adenylate cyclase
MPEWTGTYANSLSERFNALTGGLSDRMDAVADGRVAPAVDDITIGSGRSIRAAVLFFDIRGFSTRTGSPEPQELKRTLLMLDCVIPMVMHVIYDHGGYVEKNTGDGVMGVIGADASDGDAANDALDAAVTIFYALSNIVNPFLAGLGIARVDARVGIDQGNLLLARVGVPTGGARHARNFLTAVGPAANIACRIEQLAGTNQIWVGDLIRLNARPSRAMAFEAATPAGWNWFHHGTASPYWVWRFTETRTYPFIASLGSLLSGWNR